MRRHPNPVGSNRKCNCIYQRKRALDECLYGEGRNLVAWAKDSIKEGNLKHIIDSDIKGEISPKCLKKFVSITERCLLKDPDPRPTIADVVASLETTLALQEKFNTQAASSRTIFGRMVDMLPFTSNGEYSVQVPSNSSKGNNNLQEMNYDADSESHLSMKSDIYGFGVVLLESISGQRVVDVNRPEEQQNLVRWATQIQSNRRNVKEIMDPRLQHNYPLQGDSECFALALRCVKRKAKDRPSSEEVLQTLEHIHSLHS
ncbi:hypothetical protein L1987_30803 [Smallanthus sonchifolius]|uniref:Uncharacterized protein n=1 Tax=Smallanthus sonchifolius TaxID=185202 RepID=A0ACB9I6H8_9ASTR|nr:hypothetical protein L1987_30803 [Smallanthus sonchifolius]